MHAYRREPRRPPAPIVVDHVQERGLVAPRHPVHRRWLGKQVRTVSRERGNDSVGTRELGSDGGATVPPQRASPGAEESARSSAAAVVGDRREVCHAFAQNNGVRTDGVANARRQVLRRELIRRRPLQSLELRNALRMALRIVIAFLRHGTGVQSQRLESLVELSQRRGRVRPENLLCMYVPQRRLLLQGIHVDVNDLR